MGWRAENARDEDERALWRQLPLRERYYWGRVALAAAIIVFVVVVKWLS